MSRSFNGGPNERRTKWWHGEWNKFLRCAGLISKKMPGMTIVFSFNNSSKNVWCPRQSDTALRAVQEFTHQAVVEWRRELFEVEPDVERARRWDFDLEVEVLEAREDVVTLALVVFLKCDLRRQRVSIKRSAELFEGALTLSSLAWAGSNNGMAAS